MTTPASTTSIRAHNHAILAALALFDINIIHTLTSMFGNGRIVEHYIEHNHLVMKTQNEAYGSRYWALNLETYEWNTELSDLKETFAQRKQANRRLFSLFVNDATVLDELAETARHIPVVACAKNGKYLVFAQNIFGYTTFQYYDLTTRAFDDAKSIQHSIDYRLKKNK